MYIKTLIELCAKIFIDNWKLWALGIFVNTIYVIKKEKEQNEK